MPPPNALAPTPAVAEFPLTVEFVRDNVPKLSMPPPTAPEVVVPVAVFPLTVESTRCRVPSTFWMAPTAANAVLVEWFPVTVTLSSVTTAPPSMLKLPGPEFELPPVRVRSLKCTVGARAIEPPPMIVVDPSPCRVMSLLMKKFPVQVPVTSRVSPAAAAVMAVWRSSTGQFTAVVVAWATPGTRAGTAARARTDTITARTAERTLIGTSPTLEPDAEIVIRHRQGQGDDWRRLPSRGIGQSIGSLSAVLQPPSPAFPQVGAPGGIRTPDLLIRSQTLYPD